MRRLQPTGDDVDPGEEWADWDHDNSDGAEPDETVPIPGGESRQSRE
jgi:hypothetical protein